MSNFSLYAGTVGQGIWRSVDGGETFARCGKGMFIEAEVRALVAHPHNPGVLFAGTDGGLFKTENGGDQWQRLPAPFDPGAGWQKGIQIWSLLLLPGNAASGAAASGATGSGQSDVLFAGTCPAAVYRSRDGGASWEEIEAGFEPECDVLIYNRITCLRAEQSGTGGTGTLWAGAEIGGLRRSVDGGTSWEALGEGLSSSDIHDFLAVPVPASNATPGATPTLLATTNNDLNISMDGGHTWQRQNVKEKWGQGYCRGMAARADDPNTIFLGNGNGVPGSFGTVQVSRDGGQSWQTARFSMPPNSTIWSFATHPANPQLVFCVSVLGHVFRSEDGGASWTKCHHEFGEVRSLVLGH